MPTKFAAAKLSTIQPTAEELAKAKEELKRMDAKQIHSKKTSMAAFLKANPDLDATSSTPRDSEALLQKWLVHAARQKTTKKTTAAEKTKTQTKGVSHTLNWWSREQMDLKLGPKKSLHWRDSEQLATRPDRLTKSTDPDFLEYGVPNDIETWSESSLRRLKLQVETELAEEDVDILDAALEPTLKGSMNTTGSEASSSKPAEASEDSPTKKMALAVEQLKQQLEPTLMKYQHYLIKAKTIKGKGEAKKGLELQLVEPFLKKVELQIKKIQSLVKTLERLLVETVEDEKIPAIVDAMADIDSSYEQTIEYAHRFKLLDDESSAGPKQKRRKKN